MLHALAKVYTSTTGTGSVTLGAAVPGFKTFDAAGVGDGENVSYGIVDGVNRETGTGTYNTTTKVLTRAVVASTNSDAALSLTGAAIVFLTPTTGDLELGVTTQTASYTAVLTDRNSVVEMSNAAAVNFTLPPNSSVPFRIGTQITIAQTGAGQVTIVAGAGVTLRNPADVNPKTRVQYSAVTAVKIASDTWLLAGDFG